jgi:hypothetical protein
VKKHGFKIFWRSSVVREADPGQELINNSCQTLFQRPPWISNIAGQFPR